MEDRLLKVSEVAKVLGVNRNYVYDLIKHNLLKSMKLGCRKVRQTTLDQFLQMYDGMDFTDMKNLKEYNPSDEPQTDYETED